MQLSLKIEKLVPRFWISLLLTLPFLAKRIHPGLSFFFCTIVLAIGGRPFFHAAFKEKEKHALLISLSILIAYGYSILALLFMEKPVVYFAESAEMTTVCLLGELFTSHVAEIPSSYLHSLLEIGTKKVLKLFPDGQTKPTFAKELEVGDCIRVQTGEILGHDGMVISGAGELDESLIFGTSTPVTKSFGQTVLAGSKNLKEPFILQITETKEKSYFSKITTCLTNTLQKLNTQDKQETGYISMVLAIALALFFVWSLAQGVEKGVLVACTAIIITAGRVFDFATTFTLLQVMCAGSKQGIYLKGLDPSTDLVMMRPDQDKMKDFARQVGGLLRQTRFFAITYTVLALLITLCGIVTPFTAAIAMIVAPLVVAIHSITSFHSE